MLAAVALLACAGCGGGGNGSSAPTTTGAASPEQTLFSLKCGACHELADAGTTGTFGGSLDDAKPSRAAVVKAIEDGPGTMPADIVTGADVEKIAAYVSRVAGSGR